MAQDVMSLLEKVPGSSETTQEAIADAYSWFWVALLINAYQVCTFVCTLSVSPDSALELIHTFATRWSGICGEGYLRNLDQKAQRLPAFGEGHVGSCWYIYLTAYLGCLTLRQLPTWISV